MYEETLHVIERHSGTIYDEQGFASTTLGKLYSNMFGRLFVKAVLSRRWFSKLSAVYLSSSMSRRFLERFAKSHGIKQCDIERLGSFSEYFDRSWTGILDSDIKDFPAIAESKLSVYEIDPDLSLNIKGVHYNVENMLGSFSGISSYKWVMVFRLSMDDCHRFFFCDNGIILSRNDIPGSLHTIRSFANPYKPLMTNTRSISVLDTEHFGTVTYVEVGATLTGRIENSAVETFSKLDEKGRFLLGGSTIVLFVGDNILIDEDILDNTAKGIETKIVPGERIGCIR